MKVGVGAPARQEARVWSSIRREERPPLKRHSFSWFFFLFDTSSAFYKEANRIFWHVKMKPEGTARRCAAIQHCIRHSMPKKIGCIKGTRVPPTDGDGPWAYRARRPEQRCSEQSASNPIRLGSSLWCPFLPATDKTSTSSRSSILSIAWLCLDI